MNHAELQSLIACFDKIKSYCQDAIPLHEPIFQGNEKKYLTQCIETGFVSSVGDFVNKFEQELENYTGAHHAIATVNGTSALHISYLLANVQPKDEVLTTPLSFIATSNAISYCGATPHFVDVEENTLSICPDKLAKYLNTIAIVDNGCCYNKKTGAKISTLCLTHVLGIPGKIDKLKAVCGHYNLCLVEDAAQGLGSYYQDQHIGFGGIAGAISFNGNKIITAGGGGAILTNDDEVAKRARKLTTVAKLPHPWRYAHDEVAYNYRMPNLNAAVALAQLETLPKILESKKRIYQFYQDIFSRVSQVDFIKIPAQCLSNYWLNAIILPESLQSYRDEILQLSHDRGILTRPLWDLHHRLAIYEKCPRSDLSVADKLYQRTICLPSGVHVEKILCCFDNDSSNTS